MGYKEFEKSKKREIENMKKIFRNFAEKFQNKNKTSGRVGKSSKSSTPYCDEIANIKTVAGMYGFMKKVTNPDEIIKKSSKGYQVLRQLENEGQVATCVDSRNAGVTSLNWQLTDDKKYKDFYDNIFEIIDIYELIKDILKAPLYGFQPIEIVWTKSSDGYIVPSEITAKPQDWFFYNTENELCFNAKGHDNGIVITPEMKKFLIPRHGADYLNPYGKSVLSRCFWDVAFKKGSMEFWLKFAEKYGMPYALGKYQDGASDDEIETLLASLDNMVQDAVAAIPDNSTVELINAADKSGSSDLYKGIIDICDKNISKNILGQTLTTDSDGKGSYALGQVHATVRKDIITADKRLVENQINILLRWIHEFNFGTDDAPGFELYEEADVDEILANRDKTLTGAGIKFTKKYFMKNYGFEEEDIEVIDTKNMGNMEFTENSKGLSEYGNRLLERAFLGKAKNSNPVEAVDDIVDNFSDEDLENMIAPQIEALIKNFAENQNIKEVEETLALLFPYSTSKELEEKMAKTIFTADLWGRAQVNEVENVSKK